MSTPNFRALCAELLQPLAEYDGANPYHEHRALITRARAALAEPVGEGPDHVNLIAFAYGREPWATWLRTGGCLESAHCELSDLMTAVLARWGNRAQSAPLADLAAKLISESKPMDPEMAEALTPEARWDLYSGPAAHAIPLPQAWEVQS
jgi:hypothetical protein